MKRSFFILFLSLIFAVSCGEGAMKIGAHESEQEQEETKTDDDNGTDPAADEGETTQDDADTAQEDGDTMPDKDDTIPEDDADPLPDNDGNTITDDSDSDSPADNDSVTDNDPDPEEEPDDGGECEDGTTRTKKCTDLPQNAVWNTAEYVRQVCGDEGFTPSTAGTYNTEAASSTFENTTPSSKEPLPPDCPEGTGDVDGLCEYTGCGQYAYVMHFTTKNGTLVYKQDPTSSCFKEASTSSEQAPCCCGKPIYKFSKSGDIQETYDPAVNPMEYAASLTDGGTVTSTDTWVCKPAISCNDGYEYGKETGKCYKCSGELYFDDEKYQCRIEIGSECRFKCKAAFKWNGESCI